MPVSGEDLRKLQPKIGLETLMQTSPEDLARVQHDALANHVVSKLLAIIDMVEKGEYEALLNDNHLVYSPAGDGYGSDNHYINMAYVEGAQMDIEEAVSLLVSLQKTARASEGGE